MNITIQPGKLHGKVRVPASKSQAHRALIAAALSDGLTYIYLNALNDDIEATIEALMALGAMIDYDAQKSLLAVKPIEAAPNLNRPLRALENKAASSVDYSQVIQVDCGESGSTLRFILPVACALGVKARMTGCGRLPERPNSSLTEVLRQHGAHINSDYLPLELSGAITGGTWSLPGDISSQYITGLLFALPLLSEDSDILLTTPLQSAGYVAMTLETLSDFGISIEATARGYHIHGGQRYRSPGELYIEGDWSAAAFWAAANALGSEVEIEGISSRSTQGDRAILKMLGQRKIDARDVPDLVPALAAVAAALPQRTIITGAKRLRHKESDRLQTTAEMISALGGCVEVTEDGLIIDGGAVRGGTVQGHNDHRIVMAAAILATRAESPVTITDAEAIAKSYPAFFDDFVKLGGRKTIMRNS